MIDGVLLLGFGGPTPGCCGREPTCRLRGGDGSRAPWSCEAECFVSGILGDQPGRAGRVAQVSAHYAALGGFSPFTERTLAQAEALRQALAARGHAIPVAVGCRHWTPWIGDGLAELAQAGCRSVALAIMAPHQSSVSWDWYLKAAGEAAEQLGERAPALVGVAAPWFDQPGFIAASAERIRQCAREAGWSDQRLADAALICTAHAIPQPVERTSPYRAQVVATAEAIAQALGRDRDQVSVAFQSAPEDSRIPWSTPTIEQALDATHAVGLRDCMVFACGFLVDHTEVRWDLDHEAAEHAAALGLTMLRAGSVDDHPQFIDMLAQRVLACA